MNLLELRWYATLIACTYWWGPACEASGGVGPAGTSGRDASPSGQDLAEGPTDGASADYASDLPICLAPWPRLADDQVFGEVESRHLPELQQVIGRFLERSVVLYQGSFEASDTRGNWDAATGNRHVSSPNALAWVDPVSWPSLGHVLVLVDRATGSGVGLRQLADAPQHTAGSLITDCHPATGFPSQCTGCVPLLESSPDPLDIGPLVAAGVWPSGGQHADLTIEASLVTLDHGPLSSDDVRLLLESVCPAALGFSSFEIDGDRTLAVPIEGMFGKLVPAPDCIATCSAASPEPYAKPTSYENCHQEVTYTAELFIQLDNPAVRGLRSLTLGEQFVWCNYADPCGGAAIFQNQFSLD